MTTELKFLQPATMGTAYAKIGLMGFAGSGKSFTAAEIAIGLARASKGNRVAFFDTEKGSDFLIDRFKASDISLLTHKGRAFVDLISVMKEVEAAKIPVLIMDSITHVWRDLCDSYQKKLNKKSLNMRDWNILKAQWKEFTDLYVNSNIHLLMLGRAGYEYDMQMNEQTGKEEMLKSGTKMKVEGETGFEPDLLIEMERVEERDRIVNRAWVKKDRTNTMNGKWFDYPTYKTFEPFFAKLSIGKAHTGVNTTRTSEQAFDDPDWSAEEVKRRREIALETIEAYCVKAGLAGTAAEAKKKKIELFEKVFGTPSWAQISNQKITVLEESVHSLRTALFGGGDAT